MEDAEGLAVAEVVVLFEFGVVFGSCGVCCCPLGV